MRYMIAIFCTALSFPSSAASEIFETSITPQRNIPDDPWSAPDESICGTFFEEIPIAVQTPDVIDENTGLIVTVLGLINDISCTGADPKIIANESWTEEKNCVQITVWNRNMSYRFPISMGKMAVTDVIRATGWAIDEYDLNTRRIYLYGESGGGLVSLQALQAAPELWSEAHIHSAITLMTLNSDRQSGEYITVWNNNLQFPQSGDVRADAERALRSPQIHIPQDPSSQ